MENNLLLFYAEIISPRLKYIATTILEEHLGIQIQFTTHLEAFQQSNLPKIKYDSVPDSTCVSIGKSALLFEKNITPQKIDYHLFKNIPIIFHQPLGYSLPFDVFAASFFLMSRYEEYLPHTPDFHGRFSHESSWAFQNKCLNLPLVDHYALFLKKVLSEKYATLKFQCASFQFLPTYDIDFAFRFLHKSAWQNFKSLMSFLLKNKKAALGTMTHVLRGKEKDPFDTYATIFKLHEQYQIKGIFFFLLANYGTYDKNIAHQSTALQQLIQEIYSKENVGIHPSYNAHKNERIVADEIKRLSTIISSKVVNSRQHFLKFKLPETYEILIKNEIEHDYSMGYAAFPGFRASTSKSFYFYHLMSETKTTLRIHPLCFMDATFDFYLKKNNLDSLEVMFRLIREIKKVGGTCISLFHNNSFQDFETSKNWTSDYEKIIQFCLHD